MLEVAAGRRGPPAVRPLRRGAVRRVRHRLSGGGRVALHGETTGPVSRHRSGDFQDGPAPPDDWHPSRPGVVRDFVPGLRRGRLDELRRIRPGVLRPPQSGGNRRESRQPAQVHPGRAEAQQARRGCRIRLLPAGPGLRWDRRQAPLAHAGFLPPCFLGDRDGRRVLRDGIRHDLLWGPPRGRAVPGGQPQAQGRHLRLGPPAHVLHVVAVVAAGTAR